MAAALRLAGLDWKVRREQCFDQRRVVVPDTFLNVRDRDNAVLGVVGNTYKIVQPVEALDFMDALIGEGLTLETAGSLHGGKRIWILARSPERNLLGDKVVPYLGLTTSFDGSSGTVAFDTVTRVVCQNTLDMALHDAARRWSCKHTSRLEDRLEEARRVMRLGDAYFTAVKSKAERYAAKKITVSDFNAIVNEVFGNEDDMTTRQKENTAHLKSQLGVALRRDDLENFKGSAWHLYNAFGDFATHLDPVRKTAEWKENIWESFIDGNKTMLIVERMLDKIAA